MDTSGDSPLRRPQCVSRSDTRGGGGGEAQEGTQTAKSQMPSFWREAVVGCLWFEHKPQREMIVKASHLAPCPLAKQL